MPNTRANYTAFVPDGGDKRGTAQILTQTARENGIDQRSIRLAKGGFDITEELADALYEDEDDSDTETSDEAPAETDGTTKRTSGNRAAKNKDSEEE